MERRDFLKQSALTAAAAAATKLSASTTPANPIARRPLGKTGEHLSIIGFGGIVVMNEDTRQLERTSWPKQSIAASIISTSHPAMATHRSGSARRSRLIARTAFSPARPKAASKDDSRKQLEESLRLLKTDHVDLYQFHALTKMTDLDKVLGPGGAMETMEAAKKEGKIRYIGFSVHSAETAVAAMDRYNFDTVLFPDQLRALLAGKLRPADSEECAGKGHGHSRAEIDGEDRVVCRPEAGSSRAEVLVPACSLSG